MPAWIYQIEGHLNDGLGENKEGSLMWGESEEYPTLAKAKKASLIEAKELKKLIEIKYKEVDTTIQSCLDGFSNKQKSIIPICPRCKVGNHHVCLQKGSSPVKCGCGCKGKWDER